MVETSHHLKPHFLKDTKVILVL